MNNKKKIIILIGIVVLDLLLVFGVVYALNSQKRKCDRQLVVARELLEKGDYNRAIVAFAMAIAIDPSNFEAYGGKAEAVAGKAGLEESIDNQIEGLLKAYLLYQDAMDVLESAGGKASSSYDYSKDFTDKQLEIQSRLESVVKEYVDELVAELNVEKIKELKEHYGEYVDVDFDAAIQKIEKIIHEDDKKLESFLRKIYEALSNKNYKVAQKLYESRECDEYREKITGCKAMVFEGEGKGAGFYHDGPYTDEPLSYFYYGNIVDGVCQGEGLWFKGRLEFETSETYEGEFRDNIPNGDICYTCVSGASNYNSKKYGKMIEGLWEGNVILEFNYENEYARFEHSEFVHGIPVNQRQSDTSLDVAVFWQEDDAGRHEYTGFSRQQMEDNFGVTDISDLSVLKSGALTFFEF